jgi:2-iminobutanoate/2-iminopropanoate deaminase
MARTAIYVPGLVHQNPIPAACLNGTQLITGMIAPLDPGTQNIPDELDARLANLFGHVEAILDAAGATWDDITKFNFSVSDNTVRAAINEWWVQQFPNPDTRPARHTQVVEVRGGVGCDFIAHVER